jgi:hypothetical protein
MRRLLSLFAVTALSGSALSLGGCVVVHDTTPPVATCDLPTFTNSQTNYPEYHISAGQTTSVPAGDTAFLISSNGTGAYRLSWTDTTGASTCFTGLVTGNGPNELTGVAGLSGHELLQTRMNGQQVAFASIPGSTYDGVDVNNAHDPLYLDLYVNGTASRVYYVDGVTRLSSPSTSNLAAIRCP